MYWAHWLGLNWLTKGTKISRSCSNLVQPVWYNRSSAGFDLIIDTSAARLSRLIPILDPPTPQPPGSPNKVKVQMARLTAVVLLLVLAVALAFVPPTPHTSKTWHD